jgi:hypothetical protein
VKLPVRAAAALGLLLGAAGSWAAPTPATSSTAAPSAAPGAAAQAEQPSGLAALALRLKARASFDPLTGYGLLERSGMRLAFSRGAPFAVLDWGRLLPIDPPFEGPAGLSFSGSAARALDSAFSEAEAAAV